MHDTAHFHSFPQLMIIIINKVPNTRSVVISVTKYPIQQSFLLCPKLSPSCPARRKKIAKNRVTQEGRPCGRASWQAVVALAANAKAAALKYCNHPRQPLPLITSYRLRHHAAAVFVLPPNSLCLRYLCYGSRSTTVVAQSFVELLATDRPTSRSGANGAMEVSSL